MKDETFVFGDVIIDNPPESLKIKLGLVPITVLDFLRERVCGDVERFSNLYTLIQDEIESIDNPLEGITASYLMAYAKLRNSLNIIHIPHNPDGD